jgi:hypothetical protein
MVGEKGDIVANAGRSHGSRSEVEIGGRTMRKGAEKGVTTSDAGRFPSRRRVSTAGLEDPLPMVRLPKRYAPRTILSFARPFRADCTHVNIIV